MLLDGNHYSKSCDSYVYSAQAMQGQSILHLLRSRTSELALIENLHSVVLVKCHNM